MLNITDISENIVKMDYSICESTGISMDDISTLKWEMGLYYLNIVLEDMPEAQSKLSKQKFFWGWWSLQFYRRSVQWSNYVARDILECSLSSFKKFQNNQLRSTPISEQLYQLAITKNTIKTQ